ncbi:MAG: carboxy terminal-processing peptidase [Myxococcota bacterium]
MTELRPPHLLRAAALPLALCSAACVQTRNAEAAILQCDDLGGLLAAYQTVHYSVRRIDGAVKSRAVEQFVEGLDPSRTLLLESEAKSLTARLESGFDKLRRGECGALDEAYAVVLKRAAEDTKRAARVVEGKYAVDRSVKIVLDPDERGYPATDAEREKIGSDLVHFQMANYLKSGIDMDKAKKQLVHRYELAEKRLQERASQGRLAEMFAEAFAAALDPHTSYLSHDSLVDFQINMRLSLEGIGAALRSADGFTYIDQIIPGGGAEKSGKLRPKDKIIAVKQDGEEAQPVSTIDMSLRDVVKMIRGKKGTKVTLTLLRDSAETKTFDVTIIRDKIDVSQQAAKIDFQERSLDGKTSKVAVIELPSFYGSGASDEGRSSYEDMKKLVAEARAAKADAMVLDLSKNGGGYLEEAVRISGLFLARGAVVSTQDTDGDVSVLSDDDPDTEWAGPLVVLVSPMSASASEILAGALQSYRRALVVGAGKSSFGKGSVQTVRPLPRNLGAMKVTTGMYFLPNGESTQQRGVDVDIVVPSLLSTIEMGEKDLDYSLPPQSTPPFRSAGVNAKGEDHWQPVTALSVADLAERSRKRVAQKPAFREVESEIEKANEKKAEISLAELLDEEEDEKAEDANKKTEAADKKAEAADKKTEAADKKTDGDAVAEAEEEDEEESLFERLEKVFVAEAVDVAVDLARRQAPKQIGARTSGPGEQRLPARR